MDRAAAATAAESLAELAAGHPQLVARAQRLAERIRAGRFHVAVVGEFKRGKSTMVNALLGTPVLPMGVLPLTAVATEVAFGEPGATVVYLDGRREQVGLDALADYVTELANADNRLGVARVEVAVDADLLATGLVLVDTPGVGSIHAHNTSAALDAYAAADGAIVVLAADTPLSDAERDTLAAFSRRRARTFVVLNKADHLGPGELEEVRAFVAGAIGDAAAGDGTPPVWAVSARNALARASGGPDAGDAGEFDEFMAAFGGFVERDLAGARDLAAAGEVQRLAGELGDLIRLELAAADLDATTLARRVEDLRRAARAEQDAFAADRLLLAERTRALADEIGHRLRGAARAAAARRAPDLTTAADRVAVSRLEGVLRDEIEQIVREEFDEILASESERVEVEWAAIAEQLRDRARRRVDAVRDTAAGLFDTDLGPVEIPDLTARPERFDFLFVHLPSTTEPVEKLLARVVPGRVRRPRLLRRARTELALELDKHAGRARHDLAVRLDALRERFDATLAGALEHAIGAYLAAAGRGEELREGDARAIEDARARLARVAALGDVV